VDESRNPKNNQIVWDIFEGDLVKVKKYNLNGELYYESGIVISDKIDDQLLLFPYVNIYVFKSAIVERHLPNTVEIISPKRCDRP
jgi:hypothetical protein|tara:strand:- start:977 stop:1231 length:255 start_codon:yes stop_codon:yes gene_type:complete